MAGWLSKIGADSQIDSYPKLKALREKVTKLPKIAEWLSKRPETSFWMLHVKPNGALETQTL